MIDELSEPTLRNPHNIEVVASFVRIMLGEVRLRTNVETSARASREVSARVLLSHVSTASAVTATPATKGKGKCTKSLTED
eukprot:12929534-Prorocentrum_lima.AAC.1